MVTSQRLFRSVSDVQLAASEWLIAYGASYFLASVQSAFVVTALYTQRHETTLALTIDGELIHTTDEHLFYVRDKAWVEAGELSVGTEILKSYGSYGIVEAVIVISEPQTMYNLTIALAHTFVVGEQGWVVHNQDLSDIGH
jgi:intein/homing endonuclease